MKKDIFQPTFDRVMHLAGVDAEQFGEALTDLAVEFAESYVGSHARFAAAREALYRTAAFWVWFKRLVANGSLGWISSLNDGPSLSPYRRWQQWQRLMHTYLHLYTPNEIVLNEYCKQLQAFPSPSGGGDSKIVSFL